VKQVEQGVPKPANAEFPSLVAGGGGKGGSRCRSQVGFGGAILSDCQGEEKDVNESMHHDDDFLVGMDWNEAVVFLLVE
jgi:hypothetical protein